MNMDRERELRKQKNAEIAQKVKNGEWVPAAIDMWQSWFPNRGKIKKIKNPLNVLNTIK